MDAFQESTDEYCNISRSNKYILIPSMFQLLFIIIYIGLKSVVSMLYLLSIKYIDFDKGTFPNVMRREYISFVRRRDIPQWN